MKKVKMVITSGLVAAALLTSTAGFGKSAIAAPQGTISFIFDDGDKSVINEAFPVFEKYGEEASVAIYTNGIGATGRMTVNDLKVLSGNGWEVMSHGVTHKSLGNMTYDEIGYELVKSKSVLSSLGFNVRGFVAPYSNYPRFAKSHLPNNYDYAFSGYVDSRTNDGSAFTQTLTDRWFLVRANMYGMSLEKMKSFVDVAHEKRMWLVFYEHKINSTSEHTTKAELDALLAYAKGKVNIKNPSQLYQ
jgi:peptidoglycan/xylan/chitin deacetylase (PgdA/CDA1 family)